MGTYSLENYEKYKTTKCRPVYLEKPGKKIQLFQPEWSVCEEKPGIYKLPLPDFTKTDTLWLLKLNLTPPQWSRADPSDVENFIRQAGSLYSNYPQMGGVVLSLPAYVKNTGSILWKAYIDAFAPLFTIADNKNPDLIAWLQEEGLPFGLLLIGEEPWIDIRAFLAHHHLQKVWMHAPVYALLPCAADCPHCIKACNDFHVTAADTTILQGPQLIPKRVTFPQTVSSEGAMPLRLWWDNCGSSPLYGSYSTQLYLRGKTDAIITLANQKNGWMPGDSTYHEIITLPALPSGIIKLYLRVFDSHGAEVPLSIDAEIIRADESNWYYLGSFKVDTIARPELFAAWNQYYPEGYYPLEDPAQPE